jgi:hypothetical protein
MPIIDDPQPDTHPVRLLVGGREMPATLNTVQAAEFLGVDRQTLIARRGTGMLPVEPLNVGHRLKWPTARIADALGIPWEIIPEDVPA